MEKRHGFLCPNTSLQTRLNVKKNEYPHLIFTQLFVFYRDFNSLSPHDVKGNCKKAFDAGVSLGIPRVIEPSDMDMLAGNNVKNTQIYGSMDYVPVLGVS